MKNSKKDNQSKDDLLEPGKFYILNNQYDEALKFFIERLKEDENNPEIYYHLGLIYEAKNEFNTAKEMYEKVLSISPNHKLAKKRLDNLLGI